MSQYPSDEDSYANLPAYKDVDAGWGYDQNWCSIFNDHPQWWLDNSHIDTKWKFRDSLTKNSLTRDQFRYICEREIAIRESKSLDDALEQVHQKYEGALQQLADMETFSTGAIREVKKGKGNPTTMLCGFPHILTELHKHMDNPLGRNWEKGMPMSSFVNGAFRHFLEEVSGNGDDKSLVSCIWNLMCYAETKHRIQNGTLPAELDDVDRTPHSEIKYASD